MREFFDFSQKIFFFDNLVEIESFVIGFVDNDNKY